MVVALIGAFLIEYPAPQEPIRCHLVEPPPASVTLPLRAALPLPRGQLRLPDAESGREPIIAVHFSQSERSLGAPALPLWRWPDGSAGVLLLTALVPTSAGDDLGFAVTPLRDQGGIAARASMPPHQPAIPDPLPLWTELTDPWDRVHIAHLEPDPEAGPNGVLFDTGVLRARRFIAMHRMRDGEAAGRALLPLRAWLLTWHGERHAELTLQLANPANGEKSLGPIRFGALALRVHDSRLRYRIALADEQAIPPAMPHADGGVHQWLLPPAPTHYLGEGTAKTFRLQLFHDSEGATDVERAAGPRPAALALPDLDATRRSGAFGAHGGPAPRIEGAADLASSLVSEWRRQRRFGPFGDFGDPANGGAPGALRNGPSSLHNVLRWQNTDLLQIAEAMLFQHSLRPTPGQVAHAPEELEPWRRGLGPLAIAAPHGFTMPDYEHASALLPYDFWWLTGDPFVRDELARMRGLWTVLRNTPFPTSRGEGWCLQSLALIARATGDEMLLADLRQHIHERLLPALSPGRQVAIAQPAHVDVLDGKEPFDAPWQMAALIHGLHAVWTQTGDPAIRDGILQIAGVMAGPGWLEDHGPKTFVAARDASRYSLAATPADDAGTAVMTVGAFALAAEVADDPVLVAQMKARVELLLGRFAPVQELHRQQVAAANVWLQLALDRRSRHQ